MYRDPPRPPPVGVPVGGNAEDALNPKVCEFVMKFLPHSPWFYAKDACLKTPVISQTHEEASRNVENYNDVEPPERCEIVRCT